MPTNTFHSWFRLESQFSFTSKLSPWQDHLLRIQMFCLCPNWVRILCVRSTDVWVAPQLAHSIPTAMLPLRLIADPGLFTVWSMMRQFVMRWGASLAQAGTFSPAVITGNIQREVSSLPVYVFSFELPAISGLGNTRPKPILITVN